MNERWKQKNKPPSLEARFDFESFSTLRDFLDDVAEVAEKLNHHPNISFGRSHASLIIYGQGEEIAEVDIALAEGVDECFHRFSND